MKFFIQHRFSTVIDTKSLCQNCHINQQIIIGFSGSYNPIIGNDVTVIEGAIVIVNVLVEHESIIWAEVVLIKNVSARDIIVDKSFRILKRNVEKIIW